MKKFFGLLCGLSLLLSVPGCGGGPGEPTNVAEGAGQSELEKYEAMVKAEGEAGNALGAESAGEPADAGSPTE